MRKLLLLLTLLFLKVSVNAVSLKGQILAKKGTIPSKVYVASFLNQTAIDTIAVNLYGGFTYELKETVPTLYRAQCGRGSFLFFVAPQSKEVRVKLSTENGDIINAETEDYKEDEAYNALTKLFETFDVAIGKAIEENANDTLYQIILNDFYREMQGFSVYYKGTLAADIIIEMRKFDPQKLTTPNTLSNYRKIFFDKVNFTDTALTAIPIYANMVDFFSKELCTAASDEQRKRAISGLMKKTSLIKRNYNFTAEKIFASAVTGKSDKTAHTFIEWMQKDADTNSLPVLYAKAKRLAASMPGQNYKDLDLGNKPTGNSLAQVVAKNKYTLLVFWQSTCQHCRETLPHIKQLHSFFGNKSFDVFAVATDDEPEPWQVFLKELQPNWASNAIITEPNNPTLKHYFITQLPTLILISQNGVIEKRLSGIKEIGTFLEAKLQ